MRDKWPMKDRIDATLALSYAFRDVVVEVLKADSSLMVLFVGINQRCGKRQAVEIKEVALSSESCCGVVVDGRGGGHLVFLIGGRISRNNIDRQRYGCQDKKGMEKQHGVRIMAVEVQIRWLWTWPGRSS
ncbi:hypothetical protein Tco_1541043 [Tanacetum coccineum]